MSTKVRSKFETDFDTNLNLILEQRVLKFEKHKLNKEALISIQKGAKKD
jgi:hypothetical protein